MTDELGTIGIVGVILMVLFLGLWFFAELQANTIYPKVYKAISQETRFEKDKFLCLERHGNVLTSTAFIGKSYNCLSTYKIDEVNTVLDKAVTENTEGIIWEGSNGTGELWKIERNYYRFSISATKDNNFKP